MLGLRKELTENIEEKHVHLQTLRTPFDMWTRRLLGTVTDIREHLCQELSLMIQGEAQMTKTNRD
jgi:hypothetical protein